MAYKLSVEAEDDVIGIYISGAEQFGLSQAEHYHNNLEKIFEFISEYPQVARVRKELSPSVRVHPFGSHFIMYNVDEAGDVFIIRIRHAHEDWLTH
jgi:toxin ParE1/3/4